MTARFVIGKLIGIASALLVLSIVAFGMVRLMPGDVVDSLTAGESTSPEVRAAIEERYGLDRPVYVQYFIWLGRAVQGDLGYTVSGGQPVMEALMEKSMPSLQLALMAVLLGVLGSLVLGTLAAYFRGRAVDRVSSGIALIGTSVPDFVISLLLILLVAVPLGLPTFGYVPISDGVGSWLSHLILPASALALTLVGLLTRLTRNSVISTLREDFVRTARSKGVGGRRMLGRHVLRPSMIPVVTTAGLQLVSVVGGVVVIEVVFSIPGIGQLILNGIRERDFAVIQAATMTIGVIAIAVSLAVDVIYRLLDPRIRT